MLVATGRLSALLFCRTRPVPVRPTTWALTVYSAVVQVIMTPVMSPVVTGPTFADGVRVWTGAVGWVRTVTLYMPPLAARPRNMYAVAPAGTVMSSPPLFCRTRPAPVRPMIVPRTWYVVVAQATATETSPPPTVAGAEGVTVQVWVGLVGCCATVT